MKLGFITCTDFGGCPADEHEPLFTRDDGLVVPYLRDRGLQVDPVVWGQGSSPSLDALVIRSPWDYFNAPARFLEWLDALAESGRPVFNEPSVIRWNADKRYLAELGQEGVPVVPTTYIGKEEPLGPKRVEEAMNDWGAVVLKPCVSAGAKDTFRFHAQEELSATSIQATRGRIDADPDGTWRTFQGRREFMLQPFVDEIFTRGEWSLIYFGGEFSHAVLKRPQSGRWLVQAEFGGTVSQPPVPSSVKDCGDTLAKILWATILPRIGAKSLLYARLDIIERESGPVLGELELFEPELFFQDHSASGLSLNTAAAERFHDALMRVMKTT